MFTLRDRIYSPVRHHHRRSQPIKISQGLRDSDSRHAVLETAVLPAELNPYIRTRSWIRTKVVSACKADAIDQLGESSI